MTGIRTFEGLPHRLQLVAEIDGVTYYDDSFSTTPETTLAAIAAFSEPKILIVGGSSKKSDFGELGEELSTNTSIKAIVLTFCIKIVFHFRFSQQHLTLIVDKKTPLKKDDKPCNERTQGGESVKGHTQERTFRIYIVPIFEKDGGNTSVHEHSNSGNDHNELSFDRLGIQEALPSLIKYISS
jgi:hypothetical protein